jgi:hypothetical protein
MAGKVRRSNGSTIERPKRESFDARKFATIIKGLQENTPGKELEAASIPIAKHVLKKDEGFTKIAKGPDFRGTPFDLFGFKNGSPYLIEVKTSLNGFHHPGETQKWRLQELLKRTKGLRVALLQLAVRKREYRIFYDDQTFFFSAPRLRLSQ